MYDKEQAENRYAKSVQNSRGKENSLFYGKNIKRKFVVSILQSNARKRCFSCNVVLKISSFAKSYILIFEILRLF